MSCSPQKLLPTFLIIFNTHTLYFFQLLDYHVTCYTHEIERAEIKHMEGRKPSLRHCLHVFFIKVLQHIPSVPCPRIDATQTQKGAKSLCASCRKFNRYSDFSKLSNNKD